MAHSPTPIPGTRNKNSMAERGSLRPRAAALVVIQPPRQLQQRRADHGIHGGQPEFARHAVAAGRVVATASSVPRRTSRPAPTRERRAVPTRRGEPDPDRPADTTGRPRSHPRPEGCVRCRMGTQINRTICRRRDASRDGAPAAEAGRTFSVAPGTDEWQEGGTDAITVVPCVLATTDDPRRKGKRKGRRKRFLFSHPKRRLRSPVHDRIN